VAKDMYELQEAELENSSLQNIEKEPVLPAVAMVK
jgi:hypothetical protein